MICKICMICSAYWRLCGVLMRVRPKTVGFFRCAVKRLTISFFIFSLRLPNWAYPKWLRLGFGRRRGRHEGPPEFHENFMRECYPKNKITNHISSRTPPQFRDLIEILVRIFLSTRGDISQIYYNIFYLFIFFFKKMKKKNFLKKAGRFGM